MSMEKRNQPPDYKFLGNCPICNKKFGGARASEIEKVESVQTLYVECQKCGSSVVLGVVKNIPGLVTTVGMLTDMNREDIRRIRNLPPITPDYILEIHNYLEKK